MAKIKCGKCGEIFSIGHGELQVCPTCGCRMKVLRKNAAEESSVTDEYDALRKEYMGYMRDKLTDMRAGIDEDGVFLSRTEYNSLVSSTSGRKPNVLPVPNDGLTAAIPAELPASYYNKASSVSETAPSLSEYGDVDISDKVSFKPKKANVFLNVLVAIIVCLAAGYSFAAYFLPTLTSAWGNGEVFVPWKALPLNLVLFGVYFFPLVFAALYLIFTYRKIPKFFFAVFFIAFSLAFLAIDAVYQASLNWNGWNLEVNFFDFSSINRYKVIGAISNGFAALMLIISGIVVKGKQKS